MDFFFRFSPILLFSTALYVIMTACQASSVTRNTTEPAYPVHRAGIVNGFGVPGQYIDSDQIYSLQLHRAPNPGSAPVLELSGNQQLSLTFETLSFDSRQFRVTFTHHNPDWSRSSLPVNFFINGVFSHALDAGQVSRTQRPHYRQYAFTFPDHRFSFSKSGNYMIRVEDQDTGRPVISLPFFVTEGEGSVRSSVEQNRVPRQNLRVSHRTVSRYSLPGFVDQPLFDLEFFVVQNQFWGRAAEAGELDFSDPEEVQFETGSHQSFIGDYEFLTLSLSNLSQTNPQITGTDPDEIPPLIYLADDASGFSSAGRSVAGRFGRPDHRMNAEYANVVFTFDPGREIQPGQEIYLVGDFNNWTVRSGNRLIKNESISRWQTNAIIKEGTYHYKYVLIEGYTLDDLLFDDLFGSTQQEYHTFVYMRDNREFYYRLLNVSRFTTDI